MVQSRYLPCSSTSQSSRSIYVTGTCSCSTRSTIIRNKEFSINSEREYHITQQCFSLQPSIILCNKQMSTNTDIQVTIGRHHFCLSMYLDNIEYYTSKINTSLIRAERRKILTLTRIIPVSRIGISTIRTSRASGA